MIWSDGDMTPIEILEKSANLRKIDALHVETKLWSVRDEPKYVYQDVVRCYNKYKEEREK